MTTFYFTYGSSENYPFCGGWSEVIAENAAQAVRIFRAKHPDYTPGIINCCDYYTEEQFHSTEMASGNLGAKCHEVIGLYSIDKHSDSCCFCGKPLTIYEQNSPAPICGGACCNACNLELVLPARMLMEVSNRA